MVRIENLFKIEKLADIVAHNRDYYFVTLGCPNYEERSIDCISNLEKLAQQNSVSHLMRYEIFFLKNRRNNNLVLEELKLLYSDTLRTCLGNNPTNNRSTWYKIDYPNNFNPRGLFSKLSRKLKKYSKERGVYLHIDISTMPRGIVFGLCEIISDWIKDENIKLSNVFFSCVSPGKYSQLPYAQEVGSLRGFITGEPISVEGQQDIRTVIFPSMTGHESKLLLDELNQIAHDQKNAIFLQIDADDFLTSMETMRANQLLMEQGDSTQYYYCSLGDAIYELADYFHKEENERVQLSPDSRRLYIVAPFGSKIMLPVSYFALKALQEISTNDMLDIEICNAQGFQYTSVYSIGVGETCTFSIQIPQR